MLKVNNKNICPSCFVTLDEGTSTCSTCGYTENALQDGDHLAVGTILKGNYVVGKVLGRGGFGVTYLGYDIHNDKKVAIKEYYPVGLAFRSPGTAGITTFSGEKGESYQNGVEKFYEEAKTISRFNGNPNIINVHEFFYENNTAYFVMEYVSGIDLNQYILQNGGNIPYQRAMEIMTPIMNALIIIHSVGVLHRDISPDNIYLSDDGEIKLIDFGAARQVIGEETKGLSVILKQGFAPFEQYQKKGRQGPWSDVYALGATMYYAVTGKQPEEAMSRLEQDDLIMPSLLGIEIHPLFEIILEKMLAMRIEDRYQSVFELKNDFSKIDLSAADDSFEKSFEDAFKSGKTASVYPVLKKSTVVQEEKVQPKKWTKNTTIITSAVVGVLLILSFTVLGIYLSKNKPSNNSFGNAINNGLVASSDGWLYYSNADDLRYLYKARTDGTSKMKLNEEYTSDITVLGDWIYYMNADGYHIYKVHTDGSLKTKITDDKTNHFVIVGDCIYYINESDESKLYKMRTDGTEKKRLTDDESNFINVIGNWIYYTDEDSCICKIRTDGTGKAIITKDTSAYINVVGDWIYFQNYHDNENLYKMRTDGTGKVKINDDISSGINVAGDWIYYENKSDGSKPYKIRIDGTGRQKISNDECMFINIAGDWVYYEIPNDSYPIYKIRTDGTGRILED